MFRVHGIYNFEQNTISTKSWKKNPLACLICTLKIFSRPVYPIQPSTSDANEATVMETEEPEYETSKTVPEEIVSFLIGF